MHLLKCNFFNRSSATHLSINRRLAIITIANRCLYAFFKYKVWKANKEESSLLICSSKITTFKVPQSENRIQAQRQKYKARQKNSFHIHFHEEKQVFHNSSPIICISYLLQWQSKKGKYLINWIIRWSPGTIFLQ